MKNYVKKFMSLLIASIMILTVLAVTPIYAEESQIPQMEWGRLPIGGGGFVSGIVTGQKAMYLRTDVGGAYRYEEGKWIQLLNGISEEDRGYLSVESIAIDPTDDDIVYMFAGCNYFSDARSVIFRSTDGGRTIDTVDVSDYIRTHGNGPGRQNGERLAIDPNNTNVLYCGGRTGGLIKSMDYGKTWAMVETLDVFDTEVKWPQWTDLVLKSTKNQNGICSVVVDVNDSDIVYVAVSKIGETNVYVTRDGCKTWSALDATLPTNLYPQRLKLDANNDLLIMYSDGIACDGSNGAAYRYDTTVGGLTNISLPSDHPVGDITSLKDDANKLVATTCGRWWTQAWSDDWEENCYGDVTFVSTDGGATWTQNDIGGKYGSTNRLHNGGFTWIFGKAIHWSGCIVINPNNDNQIFITSGNGVFSSDNIWDEEPQFYFNSHGIEEVVALDLVSVPDGYVYSAIGDYDGFIHKNFNDYAPVHSPNLGSTSAIAYCPSNPNIMVRASLDGMTNPTGYYSLDAGESWIALGDGKNLTNGKCAITELADGTYRIFWSGVEGNETFYTDDFGQSWTKCIGVGGKLHLAVDSEKPNYIYAGGNDNNPYDPNYKSHNFLYVSDDYGKSFEKNIICEYDKAEEYGRIAFSTGTSGKVFAPAGYYGLWVTTDHGKNFRKFDDVQYCSAVGVGKAKTEGGPLTIYIWGEANDTGVRGIYRSTDDGETWIRINDDEHQFGGPGNGKFIIGDMNTFGTVYMSTVGMGIVYGKEADGTQPEDILGDVNGNGVVDIADIITLKKHLLNVKPLNSTQAKRADVNKDKKIDAFDYIKIMQILVNK